MEVTYNNNNKLIISYNDKVNDDNNIYAKERIILTSFTVLEIKNNKVDNNNESISTGIGMYDILDYDIDIICLTMIYCFKLGLYNITLPSLVITKI